MDDRSVLSAFTVVCTVRPTRGGINVRVELKPAGKHSTVRPLWSERRYPIVSTRLHGGAVDAATLTALRNAVAYEIGSWLI